MGIADPHCHTTASDGMVEPAELVQAAVSARLDLIAVCDHDHQERLGARVGASDSHFGAHDLSQVVTEFDGSTTEDFRRAVLARRTRPRARRRSTVPAGLALRQQWRSLVLLPLLRASRRL